MQYCSFEYTPRKPEETLLYPVVAEQLETSFRDNKIANVLSRSSSKNVELNIFPQSPGRGGRVHLTGQEGLQMAATTP